jgi:choline dehydrogenase
MANEFDYVVVGAGTAGCVLANRLSADPANRVLLLEAGPPDTARREVKIPVAFGKLFHTDLDWNYRTEPEPGLNGRGVYWPRGKTLGGSSSINAMMYVRGSPLDYDGWEKLGNEGWSWEDVLPTFKRSENNERGADAYPGTGGPLNVADLRYVHPLTRAFIEAGKEMGWPFNPDFNGPTQVGIGLTQVTQKGGRRWSEADAYLRPAMSRPNLKVETIALAEKVVFEQRRATAVQYVTGGLTRVTARAKREVILAAGAINSPQLLLLSGIGPADHLRGVGVQPIHDLPGVGQNLQDHIAAAVQYLMTRPESLLNATSPGALIQFLAFGRGMLTSNVAEATAFASTSPDLPAPDIQFVFAAALYNPEVPDSTEHGYSLGPMLLTPKSRGRIELRSAHPTFPAAIHAGYLSDPAGDVMRRLVAALKVTRKLAQAQALEPYRGAEIRPGPDVKSDEDLEEYVRQTAATLYHPVGTCKMGSDRMAVVDDQLRVQGIEGLRVIDASVMPVIPRGNTNAPTIMIGEKGADLVLAAT